VLYGVTTNQKRSLKCIILKFIFLSVPRIVSDEIDILIFLNFLIKRAHLVHFYCTSILGLIMTILSDEICVQQNISRARLYINVVKSFKCAAFMYVCTNVKRTLAQFCRRTSIKKKTPVIKFVFICRIDYVKFEFRTHRPSKILWPTPEPFYRRPKIRFSTYCNIRVYLNFTINLREHKLRLRL